MSASETLIKMGLYMEIWTKEPQNMFANLLNNHDIIYDIIYDHLIFTASRLGIG